MFSKLSHIGYREERYRRADVNNPLLLGLSTIELNVSELCNRKCSFCPRYDESVYPNQKKFMSTATVDALVKQLKWCGWYGDVHIAGFGEPHTHPTLLQIIKILKSYNNLFIEIATNGDRLIDNDIEFTKKLFDAGLDLLTIDCYDGDAQYYERISTCQVLPEGKYRLSNKPDTANFQLFQGHPDHKSTEQLIDEFGFTNRAGIMGKTETLDRECYLPFYKTLIDWNGNMLLCCNDWHRKGGDFGNINKDSIIDAWNSDKMIKKRRRLSEGKRDDVCATCDIDGKKFGLKSFELHESHYNYILHKLVD